MNANLRQEFDALTEELGDGGIPMDKLDQWVKRSELAGHILVQAARENDVEACTAAFGRANVSANSQALLIAGQERNYEVLESMLQAAGPEACGIAGPYNFAASTMQTLAGVAQTDARIAAALQKYHEDSDKAVDQLFDGLFSEEGELETAAESAPPAAWKRFLNMLHFKS